MCGIKDFNLGKHTHIINILSYLILLLMIMIDLKLLILSIFVSNLNVFMIINYVYNFGSIFWSYFDIIL